MLTVISGNTGSTNAPKGTVIQKCAYYISNRTQLQISANGGWTFPISVQECTHVDFYVGELSSSARQFGGTMIVNNPTIPEKLLINPYDTWHVNIEIRTKDKFNTYIWFQQVNMNAVVYSILGYTITE